jgi:hypothetical protein
MGSSHDAVRAELGRRQVLSRLHDPGQPGGGVMLTDRQRRNIETMRKEGRAAGDLDEIESVAASLLPERRFDVVGCWPADRLGELLEQRPDLEAEVIRRRGGELTQL